MSQNSYASFPDPESHTTTLGWRRLEDIADSRQPPQKDLLPQSPALVP